MDAQSLKEILEAAILVGQLNPDKHPKYLLEQLLITILNADKTGKIDLSALVGE